MKKKSIIITVVISFCIASKVFSYKPDCYAQFEANYNTITSNYSNVLTSIYLEAANIIGSSWWNRDATTPMGSVNYFLNKIAQAENNYYADYSNILQQLNECVSRFG